MSSQPWDFSASSEPVGASAPSASNAPDFSASSIPVSKVGALPLAGRQFVAGGGDLLKAMDLLLPNFIRTPLDAAGQNPLTNAGERAQQFGDLAPGEVADGMGAKIAGGLARDRRPITAHAVQIAARNLARNGIAPASCGIERNRPSRFSR